MKKIKCQNFSFLSMHDDFAGRLPQDIIPTHYKLEINPDIEETTFSGTVEITFEQKDKSKPLPNVIKLHAHDPLVIDSVCRNDFPLEFEQKSHILTISNFGDLSLPISILFHGIMNDGEEGSCYGMFKTENIIATQFEADYASCVFPCFDEPCVRSTFEVTIVAPMSQHVLSNMPLASSQIMYNSRISHFQTTPPIPAYLVGFVIGSFESAHSTTKRGVPIDVYGDYETCQNILPIAIEAVEFMEEFTQINYPLPKLQLVLLPHFIFGGMENNGLITLRNYGKKKSHYTDLVYHEVSHHWAGNLATIKWWDSLWIPEGLATLFPYLITEKLTNQSLHPYVISKYQNRIMKQDSSPKTLPLQSASGPETVFDDITYVKGHLIFESLRSWCGDKLFKQCLQNFFKKYTYSNFDGNDLKSCFPEKVHTIFDSLLAQSGFPVAILTDDGKACLKSFVSKKSKRSHEQLNKVYVLPIKVLIGKGDQVIEKDYIMGPDPILIEEAKDADFIKLNNKSFTYCKVYHHDRWQRALLKALEEKKIDEFEVQQAQNDMQYLIQHMELLLLNIP